MTTIENTPAQPASKDFVVRKELILKKIVLRNLAGATSADSENDVGRSDSHRTNSKVCGCCC